MTTIKHADALAESIGHHRPTDTAVFAHVSDDDRYDAQLVEQIRVARRAGNVELASRLAGELWARYDQHARSKARRHARSRHEAEDIFGDMMIRFTRWVYEQDEPLRSMPGLLSKMAYWAYCDRVAMETRNGIPTDEVDLPGAPDDAIDSMFDREWIEWAIPRAGLAERELQVIRRGLADVANATIADELDVELNNLDQIRYRALTKLRAVALGPEAT